MKENLLLYPNKSMGKKTTLRLAEMINVLFRNIIMRGNFYLSIFYFKHNVSIISWKICVKGIIPLKPKPGIALISTNQNKTSLDLVLITEKRFLCIYLTGQMERRVGSIFSCVLASQCAPVTGALPGWDATCVWLTTHYSVGKGWIIYPYGLIP